MADQFSDLQAGLDSPAFDAVEVTPSDSTDLTNVARGLYVGVTGNLVVVMKSGREVVFTNVPVGVLPISVKRVRANSSTSPTVATSASGIVALS